MSEWSKILLGGLGGALLGCVAGAWITYYFNQRHAEELDNKMKQNLAKALAVELTIFWKIYTESGLGVVIIDVLEKSNDTFFPLYRT